MRQCGVRLRKAFLAAPVHEERRRVAQAKAGIKISDHFVGWCPRELRADYQRLRRKVGAAEARRIMEAEMPGTAEHGKRVVANTTLKMLLKQEREQRDAY